MFTLQVDIWMILQLARHDQEKTSQVFNDISESKSFDNE